MTLDSAHRVADTLSVSVALATFIGWLPSIASLLSIIWMAIRIYETKTVQRWVHGAPVAPATDSKEE